MFIFTLLFCTYFGIKIEGYARIVSALTVMYYWLIWSLMCRGATILHYKKMYGFNVITLFNFDYSYISPLITKQTKLKPSLLMVCKTDRTV